jgi:lipopolysaccharide heptosyltransferase I
VKILILKPSSLGDVVQALPVLRLLKSHLPESRIFWWLESSLAPLLSDDADLAGVIPFERKRWAAPGYWPEILASARHMRRERFDWAIDLQGLARSGLCTWLANAQVSIGLDNAREGRREGARLFYDMVAPRSPRGTHAVERYLAVLPPLGIPVHGHFQWLPDRPRVAALVEERWQPAGSRWVALLPGARWENKRWPVEHFQELARRVLALAPDIRLAVLGGAADQALGSAISKAAGERCLDLTGWTSLPEMVEWLRLCALVVTNDTGPMHVAAALRKPVIALFGPTDPGNTGPYGQRDKVIQSRSLPCVPCQKGHCGYERELACLRDILPEQVARRASETLSQIPI